MDEGNNLLNEIDSESSDINNSADNSGSKDEIIQDANEVSADDPSERSEPGTSDPELSEEEIEEEQTPSSTVIQVTPDENSDTGYTINELDVSGLNAFIQAENEVRSVTPTSNDYYTFLGSDIEEYFSGIMALYPLNEYKAVHLRHWIQNTSYNSYYDDYYYLWYDYPSENVVEVYKQYNNTQYVVSNTTQRDLNATIVYGSSQGQSDIRKGVSYVQEIALLGAVGVCLVLYVLSAFFKHLVR